MAGGLLWAGVGLGARWALVGPRKLLYFSLLKKVAVLRRPSMCPSKIHKQTNKMLCVSSPRASVQTKGMLGGRCPECPDFQGWGQILGWYERTHFSPALAQFRTHPCHQLPGFMEQEKKNSTASVHSVRTGCSVYSAPTLCQARVQTPGTSSGGSRQTQPPTEAYPLVRRETINEELRRRKCPVGRKARQRNKGSG